jgi:hypothetical protein
VWSALSLLNFTLEFVLEQTKSEKICSLGSPAGLDTNLGVDLAALVGAASAVPLSLIPRRLTLGDFRYPMIGASAFQFADIRGSPHHVIWVEAISSCPYVVDEVWDFQYSWIWLWILAVLYIEL